MPTYDYKCARCETIFEVKKSVNAPSPTECPECKYSLVDRYYGSDTGPLVQYKGKGWFKTSGKY